MAAPPAVVSDYLFAIEIAFVDLVLYLALGAAVVLLVIGLVCAFTRR